MTEHLIIMSSSYSKGTRIALDITNKKDLMIDKDTDVVKYIKEKCGKDVSISVHSFETESKEWESVVKHDPFFKDVKCIETLDKFCRIINQDRVLKGLDVAKYIASKLRCTHLKLEKLVYFCYAEYLCNYSKKLFEDDIYAFAYGPVVKSVYEEFKGNGREVIKMNELANKVAELPAESRILFAEDGVEKLQSINATISKYGQYGATDLMNITHKDDTPWKKTDSTKMYNIISDEKIKKYHCNEI